MFIQNKSNDKGVMCDCTAVDNNIQINNIAFTEQVSKIKAMNRVEWMVSLYNGPDFYSLDEWL